MSSLKMGTIVSLVGVVCGLLAPLNAKTIAESRGGTVQVVKYTDGTWEMLVKGKPYLICGVSYNPARIGESADLANLRDWTQVDDDNDGRNDFAYQAWEDKNKNDKKDPGEVAHGDFTLMKKMNVNTLRFYNVPSKNALLGDLYRANPSTKLQYDHNVNKTLLRDAYQKYGIRFIMGNFAGAWTIGSGADWSRGTDYTNPLHRANIKDAIKAMVLENKDEPYVLMWMIGNENNIAGAARTNAITQPQAYASLIGEIATMIKDLDPNHPVAVCDGDSFNTLPYYAVYAQDVDIIAYNSYRGLSGFDTLWQSAKAIFDRPILISEYGAFAYNNSIGVDEDYQLTYHKNHWEDVLNHASRYSSGSTGNALGAVLFEWLDTWHRDGNPSQHDRGSKTWNSPDGIDHEEWFGIIGLGSGNDSLKRQLRKTYDYYAEAWSSNVLKQREVEEPNPQTELDPNPEANPTSNPGAGSQAGTDTGTVFPKVTQAIQQDLAGVLALSARIFTAEVRIPAKTFSANTNVTVAEISSPAPLFASHYQVMSSWGVEITNDLNEQPSKVVEIIWQYNSASSFPFDIHTLYAARYDELTKQYVLLPTERYPAQGKIIGRTDHFSKFTIVAVPQAAPASQSTSSSELSLYPNPIHPHSVTTGMQLSNLVDHSRIDIYTITGQLVRSYPDVSGAFSWDLKNSSGRLVSSGVYLWRIKNGTDIKLLKSAIIR